METRSKTSQDVREFRRLRAVELDQQGWRACSHSGGIGVTRGAVSQWRKLYREKGIAALPRLSQPQVVELVAMLSQGAENFWSVGQIWTQARVGELIERKFGVCYHKKILGKVVLKHVCRDMQVR